MSAHHAKETRDPGRDYPRAIFLVAVLIVAVSILGTLAIAFVVPQTELSLVSGPLQAFAFFFHSIGIGDWAMSLSRSWSPRASWVRWPPSCSCSCRASTRAIGC